MSGLSRARWPWLVLAALLAGALVVATVGDPGPRTTAERARGVAESIKCPTCQGQSVADSSAPAARAIRTEIARRIEAGETDDEIRDYIAGIYGEENLLTPPRDGVAGLVWFLGKTFGLVFLFVWMRGTLPRVRIDQLMGFAWKWLLPASLLNLFVTALAVLFIDVIRGKPL